MEAMQSQHAKQHSSSNTFQTISGGCPNRNQPAVVVLPGVQAPNPQSDPFVYFNDSRSQKSQIQSKSAGANQQFASQYMPIAPDNGTKPMSNVSTIANNAAAGYYNTNSLVNVYDDPLMDNGVGSYQEVTSFDPKKQPQTSGSTSYRSAHSQFQQYSPYPHQPQYYQEFPIEGTDRYYHQLQKPQEQLKKQMKQQVIHHEQHQPRARSFEQDQSTQRLHSNCYASAANLSMSNSSQPSNLTSHQQTNVASNKPRSNYQYSEQRQSVNEPQQYQQKSQYFGNVQPHTFTRPFHHQVRPQYSQPQQHIDLSNAQIEGWQQSYHMSSNRGNVTPGNGRVIAQFAGGSEQFDGIRSPKVGIKEITPTINMISALVQPSKTEVPKLKKPRKKMEKFESSAEVKSEMSTEPVSDFDITKFVYCTETPVIVKVSYIPPEYTTEEATSRLVSALENSNGKDSLSMFIPPSRKPMARRGRGTAAKAAPPNTPNLVEAVPKNPENYPGCSPKEQREQNDADPGKFGSGNRGSSSDTSPVRDRLGWALTETDSLPKHGIYQPYPTGNPPPSAALYLEGGSQTDSASRGTHPDFSKGYGVVANPYDRKETASFANGQGNTVPSEVVLPEQMASLLYPTNQSQLATASRFQFCNVGDLKEKGQKDKTKSKSSSKKRKRNVSSSDSNSDAAECSFNSDSSGAESESEMPGESEGEEVDDWSEIGKGRLEEKGMLSDSPELPKFVEPLWNRENVLAALRCLGMDEGMVMEQIKSIFPNDAPLPPCPDLAGKSPFSNDSTTDNTHMDSGATIPGSIMNRCDSAIESNDSRVTLDTQTHHDQEEIDLKHRNPEIPDEAKGSRLGSGMPDMLEKDVEADILDTSCNGSVRNVLKNQTIPTKICSTVTKGYLQTGDCRELAVLKATLCRSCQHIYEEKPFCHFQNIRRLDLVDGVLQCVDLETVEQQGKLEDLKEKHWVTDSKDIPSTVDIALAKYIIQNLWKSFEYFLEREQWLIDCLHQNKSNEVVKMPVYRELYESRELCDVCATTVCNLHLFCEDCGLIVCVDCVKERNELKEKKRGKGMLFEPLDLYGWPLCKTSPFEEDNEVEHVPQLLHLAQLIPDPFPYTLKCFRELSRLMQEEMKLNNISKQCLCSDIASTHHNQGQLPSTSSEKDRDLVVEEASKGRLCFCAKDESGGDVVDAEEWGRAVSWQCEGQLLVLDNEATKYSSPYRARVFREFQQVWNRGYGIVIKNCHKNEDWKDELWTPTSLNAQQSGQDVVGYIINCKTHSVVVDATVAQFWRGYDDETKRISLDDDSVPYLKFKDYPGHTTFKEALPEQHANFCRILPLPEYSAPMSEDGCVEGSGRGSYNLVTLLPDNYLTPDLGPKMYTAYGMLEQSLKATTNLHLDMSDAVNVMMNVTVAKGANEDYVRDKLLKQVKEEGIEGEDYKRVEENWKEAGAIWTIWPPDATKELRDWLLEIQSDAVSLSDVPEDLRCGLHKMDDPIHDQTIYITAELRRRFWRDRGVKGCTFVQMLGDAVFIPAGAGHQVQNLNSCVKVAEDFVSPEGVRNCAIVTQEFRELSMEHLNREDKLQLSNVIYHAIRSSVNVLKADRNGTLKQVLQERAKRAAEILAEKEAAEKERQSRQSNNIEPPPVDETMDLATSETQIPPTFEIEVTQTQTSLDEVPMDAEQSTSDNVDDAGKIGGGGIPPSEIESQIEKVSQRTESNEQGK